MVSSKQAALKPISGETSRVSPILVAWLQSTPLVPEGFAAISWFMRPTPMMEPISVCELDEGRPKYQVPRFHRMAAISSANTMAKPAPLPTCRISSTGSSDTIPKATAPVENKHAQEIESTGPDDREIRRHRIRVDYGGDGVCGVVEAVDELESQRDQQCNAQQYVRIGSGIADHRQVVRQVIARVYDSGDDHDDGQDIEPGIGFMPDELRGWPDRAHAGGR